MGPTPEYTIEINPNFGRRMGFGRTETKHILIAVVALSVSFAILYAKVGGFFSQDPVINTLGWLLFSLVAVTTSFLFHELGHKLTAQRMGAWAEFRMFPAGLVAGLVMSLFGFLIAAPGAVMISGRINDRENGIISIAGPAVNAVLGAVFLALAMLTTGKLMLLFYLIARLNIILGIFNMIPLPPLDGSKVIKWNVPAYVAMAGVLIALYVLTRVL
ncbi:MAG: site-2 protease family protein [Candidatus Methanomethylophilaceae archaeon]